MGSSDSEIDRLLCRVNQGDAQATELLMNQHRERLRKMIAVRIDPRLANRVDPSDVVQETLMIASQRLSQYAKDRPLPFYPWLRRIAWDRLVELHYHHVRAQKRSVSREQRPSIDMSDQSVWHLADQLIGSRTSPSARLVRQELHQRAREALAQLDDSDREVLVMRHLEEMDISEIAAVLGLSESAVKMRRLRAIQRLRELLALGSDEDE